MKYILKKYLKGSATTTRIYHDVACCVYVLINLRFLFYFNKGLLMQHIKEMRRISFIKTAIINSATISTAYNIVRIL